MGRRFFAGPVSRLLGTGSLCFNWWTNRERVRSGRRPTRSLWRSRNPWPDKHRVAESMVWPERGRSLDKLCVHIGGWGSALVLSGGLHSYCLEIPWLLAHIAVVSGWSERAGVAGL